MKRNELQQFIKDIEFLSQLPTAKKINRLTLAEYPFDGQLLSASNLYRTSRQLYLAVDGTFSPKVCSTLRSLRTQDLFRDQIDFTPSFTELLWFKDHFSFLVDPEEEMRALSRFNEVSLFHEQNHRIIWRILPPPPTEKRDVCRYLNFAESLVVALDLALGDELGKETSAAFERLKIIYRAGGVDSWSDQSSENYRPYLLAVVCATYYLLELIEPNDILDAVDYIFPGQKKLNRAAVRRSLELSELFTKNTNPQWQNLYWQQAYKKLHQLHKGAKADRLHLPKDPLDLEDQFEWALKVFDHYGL